jgi:acetyl esterase/lipase
VARRAARRCGARPQRDSAKGSITQVAQPYLLVHRPAQPNGMAMLLVSGGGYAHIEAGKESGPAAAWLQAQGITAFELVYRLPQEGGGVAAPFQDGQRAMRVIRARRRVAHRPGAHRHAGFFRRRAPGRHDGRRTGCGPLCTCRCGRPRLGAPDFAVLLYPVLTMQRRSTRRMRRRSCWAPIPRRRRATRCRWNQVDARTPPVFLAQALDDPISPPENSTLMAAALRRAGCPWNCTSSSTAAMAGAWAARAANRPPAGVAAGVAAGEWLAGLRGRPLSRSWEIVKS